MGSVYPNPARPGANLTVQLDHATDEKLQLQLFDISGKLVKQHFPATVKGVTRLPLALDANLIAGVYILKASVAGGQSVLQQKILIQ